MNAEEINKHYDFSNRTILFTGGTGILGAAMVEGVVAAGGNVAVLGRDGAAPDVAGTVIAVVPGALGSQWEASPKDD